MIYVSAGHYPAKKGATFEDFAEYDEALIWADLITAHLGADGVRVPTGVLKDKVNFINKGLATMAIEIHFNSAINAGQHVGQGSETLYYPGSKTGKVLAERIQTVLAKYFPPNRGAKEGWYKMNQINGPDFFLAKTACPSIIIEPEFVHRKDLIRSKRGEVCKHLAEELRSIANKGF
jgi:N-acetylmuramoyl-L-alanine amidase